MEVYDAIERATVADLRRLQLERMQASFAAAYAGCSRYRAKFDAAGVKPSDLKSLDDLRRFPFTTKADLREAYPLDLCAVPKETLARIHASSGTTGQPTVVAYTRGDVATWSDVVARCLHAAGARPGMKAHIAYGYGLFTGGLGAHYGAEALGCTVIPVSGGQTERQVRLIEDLRPEIIMVTPSYMLAILDEYRRQGLDQRQSSLRIGLFGAEPWSEGMRSEIETAFGLQAFDIYGLSEVIGPGVAQECADAPGELTIWEDHFYPEIIDPETGEPLPEGAAGELVFTSLTKQAMPIVRYRTRDLTKLLPAIGRPMRRMARVGARSDDMLIIRGVNLFPSQIEELLFGYSALAPHYEVELRRQGRLDQVRIRVESRPAANPRLAAEQANDLERLIKSTIGVSVGVQLGSAGSVMRSQGKAVRVVDRRAEPS
ncbi:MAG: AMP-binding protein [Phenylobacterium sp.]|uniref:AMP-binding protein n=1 Tax=Phenylobacterium sp. TaxID=1871053 RepID=UPI0025E4DC78|nr:AMP-binding protein [Phenylobacterium sp.]MCG9917534.1 AMP-binding protein [Phenylobacterium sp.]